MLLEWLYFELIEIKVSPGNLGFPLSGVGRWREDLMAAFEVSKGDT